MPRLPRADQIENNLTYHVYNRGNGKLDVFHDEQDFRYFLYTIKRYSTKYSLHIYHWVLMNNHFHFVLSIDSPKLISKCIGGMLQVFAQYHHKRWNSAGKLWQGRFLSQPVQKEKYLFECGRYIERNPMRAGIVGYPWDYKWSSCQVYVNNKKDDIITWDSAFESFGDNDKERIENYKEWLMEGENGLFYDMHRSVGDENFIRRLTEEKSRLIIRKRGRPLKKEPIYT